MQFATKNCLGCYSKLNLGSKFHADFATLLFHIKLRALYTLNIIIKITSQLLQVATQCTIWVAIFTQKLSTLA